MHSPSPNQGTVLKAGSSGLSKETIVGISTGGAIIGLVVGACIAVFYFRRKFRLRNQFRQASIINRLSSYSDSTSMSTRTLTDVSMRSQELYMALY